MENLRKKLNTILYIGILSTSLLVTGLVLCFAYLGINMVFLSEKQAAGDADAYNSLIKSGLLMEYIGLIIAGGCSIVMAVIVSIFGCRIIMKTDFGNAEINQNKATWGMLSVISLGGAGLIAFAIKNKKKLM